MDSVIYECENITPIIMNGANSSPELRAQSIKGWMRYWWRAITAYENIEELKNKEREVFGSLDKKAKFSIRISFEKNNLKIETQNIVPHRELEEYDGKNKFIMVNAIKNIKFNVKFMFSNSEYKELICDLFEICCVLGAIGKRSRKGFGSIKIIKKSSEEFYTPDSMEQIVNKLNKITEKCKEKKLYNYIKDEIFLIEKIKSNYPFIEKIILKKSESYASEDLLLKKIGMASHYHCNYKLVNMKDKNLLEVFSKKETEGKENKKINRYASPLYVSIIQNKNKFQPIITILHSNEMNDREILEKERKALINKI